MTNTTSPDNLITFTIEGIEDVKGQNITILDLRDIENTVCDYFVICEGTSNTQVKAIVNSVQKKVSKTTKDNPWHIEGNDNAEWVLMDYYDIIVHIFQEKTRTLYNIEDLWGDAEFTNYK